MRKLISVILICIFVLSVGAFPVIANEDIVDVNAKEALVKNNNIVMPKDGTYVPNELLIKKVDTKKLSISGKEKNDLILDMEYMFDSNVENTTVGDVGIKGNTESIAWYRATLKDGVDFEDAYRTLTKSNEYLEVCPNYIYTLDDPVVEDRYIGSDETNPDIYTQVWLSQINAFKAWDLLKDEELETVTVAVVDSGVDKDHPDLKANLIDGKNFVGTIDDNYDDQDGHGTHVAGIIAAVNNNQGIRGVSYNTKIMPVRVLGEDGAGTYADIALGIRYAVDNGAKIINLSLGGYGEDPLGEEAIEYARANDVLVVAAAGNEAFSNGKTNNQHYGSVNTPADIPGVLTVMAQAQTKSHNGDWLCDFSNYDPSPGKGVEFEIMAPGESILSTEMGGGYCFKSGTSMATPVTVGAAAVLAGMGCSVDEIWNILVKSGDILQGITLNGEPVSYPALNLEKAVSMKLNENCPYTFSIENGNISGNLNSVSIDGYDVSLSNLNTEEMAIYKNGSLISDIYLSFENFGSSDSFTITGTIGNKDIIASECNLKTGDKAYIKLGCDGAPSPNNKELSVNVTITGSKGNFVNYSNNLPAYSMDRPAEIYFSFYWDKDQGYYYDCYYLSSDNVTISKDNYSDYKGNILCIPCQVIIGENQKLTINDSIIYFGEYGRIDTILDYSRNDLDNLEINNSLLLGNTYSTINGNGCTKISNSVIYDQGVSAPVRRL